jgi:Lrp/AsnC family transcriptional regulator for asnA, asnC and gidA
LNERVRIDETDAKILRQLLRESRTSFTDLAKICHITVGAVRMRYKKLWRIGLINGEIMQVNPHSLGYRCISDIAVSTSLEDEKKVIDFLKSKPYIQYIMPLYGKYNLTTKVALHDMQELAAILEDLESNPAIQQADTMIWAEVINIDHPENLVINNASIANLENQLPPLQSYSSNRNPVVMDEIDRKIAKILSARSRTTFRKIAEQTGISTKNVIQRYRKLRGPVLTQSTITVDLRKLGFNAIAGTFVKVTNKSKMPEISAQVLKIPNLLTALRLIGFYDLFILVALQDFKEYFDLQARIRAMQGIDDTLTLLNQCAQPYPINMFRSLL